MEEGRRDDGGDAEGRSVEVLHEEEVLVLPVVPSAASLIGELWIKVMSVSREGRESETHLREN